MAFKFQPSTDKEDINLEEAVFQALGAASICWDSLSDAGVFHSDECREIGDALLAKIMDTIQEAIHQHNSTVGE